MDKILFLLPPDGAVRQVSLQLHDEWKKIVGLDKLNIFDTGKYFNAFTSMLKKNSDEIAIDLLNQSLVVQTLQYDITQLFIPALCPITLFTLKLLRKHGIKTTHWFIEDFDRVTYWRSVLDGYDLFIAIQNGAIKKECEAKNIRFAALPMAANTETFSKTKQCNTTVDIGFVGLPSSYRVAVLEKIAASGFSCVIAGEGWNNYEGSLNKYIVKREWVDAKESVSILSRADIQLNLSIKAPTDDRTNIHISPRLFDLLAMMKPVITEDIPFAKSLLFDCHYHVFTYFQDIPSIISQIKIQITKNNYQEKLRRNRAVIEAKHSWKTRAQEINKLLSPVNI